MAQGEEKNPWEVLDYLTIIAKSTTKVAVIPAIGMYYDYDYEEYVEISMRWGYKRSSVGSWSTSWAEYQFILNPGETLQLRAYLDDLYSEVDFAKGWVDSRFHISLISGSVELAGTPNSLINGHYSNVLGEYNNYFSNLFKYSKAQIKILNPKTFLPAVSLKIFCYSYMFNDCTGLTNAPELPALTLADYCYQNMFGGCTGLTTAPKLPATTLAPYCYSYMFSGCTGLIVAPELPATSLVKGCYSAMFNSCTGLIVAPELPAPTLATECYRSMFRLCTGLTTAPELPATYLVGDCYAYMFDGCTSLNYIKAMYLTTPSNLYTYKYLSDVASVGTFVKNKDATWEVWGPIGVPRTWTVILE